MTAAIESDVDVSEEDVLRAHFYRLLARLLSRPMDGDTLSMLSSLDGDDTDMGNALRALSAAAKNATPGAAEIEFNELFIGMTRGELVPYASYYITGFLNEKPLAELRTDMASFAIERADGVSEPEDHIASLCDMMAGLIVGEFGKLPCLNGQKEFYQKHVAPWALRFFTDLEATPTASLYRPVGTIGRLFMTIEDEAFSMI